MIRFLARQRFRFDMGAGFLQVINLILLVIAAGDKIFSVTGLPTRWLVPALAGGGILSVWLLGWWLDRMRFWDAYQDEQNQRNKMLREAVGKP